MYKEIATLSQGISSVSVCLSKLKSLWEEYKALVHVPSCDYEYSRSYIVHLQKIKLFQFLMGLNDSYLQARGQILTLSSLPSMNQAYALVVSDEGKKLATSAVGVLGTNPRSRTGNFDMAMYTISNNNSHYDPQKFKKS